MHRLMLSSLALAAALAACRENGGSGITAATSSGGGSPIEVTKSFSMPLKATTLTDVSNCDNAPGPYITIEGSIALGGLGGRMAFANNVKGTHTYTDENHVDVSVVPTGDAITLPKQPVQGGVGGNPFIWIKFEDGNGNAVSPEIYLGRCVQGFKKNVEVAYETLARALASITVQECANSPGPYISLEGNMGINSGLDAKFIFQNNDNPVNGPHEAVADAVVKVGLLAPGHSVTFPKQPVLGGVGGNPWMWYGFLDDDGTPMGDPSLLGRCEQLSTAS
jgi:hypothetical protein